MTKRNQRVRHPIEEPTPTRRGLISANRQQATRVYNENIAGGIYRVHALENNGQIESLTKISSIVNTTLWLIPNENGGITLMFPEDC